VVPDIGAAYDALRAKGATFIDAPHLIAPMPDHDLWMCFLRDSEGNVVGLMSEVRPPAPR
jgi:methylmalonyl-CoA/ethylmalonyl-CoA epimerase